MTAASPGGSLMSVMENLSALATRGLTFGACQAVGAEAGEKAVEPVTRFLAERLLNQGERLLRSLARANERAWQVLEFGLAGDSLWDRCTSVFSRGDDRAFRVQLRAFLDSLPADTFA